MLKPTSPITTDVKSEDVSKLIAAPSQAFALRTEIALRSAIRIAAGDGARKGRPGPGSTHSKSKSRSRSSERSWAGQEYQQTPWDAVRRPSSSSAQRWAAVERTLGQRR